MTWEELCEKAKEMGLDVYMNAIYANHLKFDIDGLIYFDDGCGGWYQAYEGIETDQMYQIMEALK